MKINDQIEKTNKILQDMLKMYMWNKLRAWEQYSCLIELLTMQFGILPH